MGISLEGDPYYDKWISIVRDAIGCLTMSERGSNWAHLPGSGGYYDQDEFIMTVWEAVRREYVSAMVDETFMNSVRSKYGKSTT